MFNVFDLTRYRCLSEAPIAGKKKKRHWFKRTFVMIRDERKILGIKMCTAKLASVELPLISKIPGAVSLSEEGKVSYLSFCSCASLICT